MPGRVEVPLSQSDSCDFRYAFDCLLKIFTRHYFPMCLARSAFPPQARPAASRGISIHRRQLLHNEGRAYNGLLEIHGP